jgi:Ni/Co efflux regulator RcnB
MRKLIMSTLALAVMMPAFAAANAQPGEIQRDRREVREERRDVQDAQRNGSPRDVREERGEYRDARRDGHSGLRAVRGDRYDNNRRDERYGAGFRQDYRGERRFRGDSYRYPRGFAYRSWAVGGFLPRAYWNDRYYIGNPYNYGLRPAYRGTRWVRVGPDALLIRQRNGAVIEVVRGLYY